MKVRFDRTRCDGFGFCAARAPESFTLDEWTYASLVGPGTIPADRQDGVRRALLDCPSHAIVELAVDPAPPPDAG